MKKENTRRGFTLIELLVVVLIIGILAAVALPQYQKAVEKARAVEAFANLRALVQAERVYQLTNGSPTSNLTALDISVSALDSNRFTYSINILPKTTYGFQIFATRIHNDVNQHKYQIYSSAYRGTNFCIAYTEEAQVICKNLCRTNSMIVDGTHWKCEIK